MGPCPLRFTFRLSPFLLLVEGEEWWEALMEAVCWMEKGRGQEEEEVRGIGPLSPWGGRAAGGIALFDLVLEVRRKRRRRRQRGFAGVSSWLLWVGR